MNVPHASQHTVKIHNHADVLYRSIIIHINPISRDRLPAGFHVAGPTCHQNPVSKQRSRGRRCTQLLLQGSGGLRSWTQGMRRMGRVSSWEVNHHLQYIDAL